MSRFSILAATFGVTAALPFFVISSTAVAEPTDAAEYVVCHAYDGYTANLPPVSAPRLVSDPYPLPDRFEQITAGDRVAIAGWALFS